mmetsp:Transcript_16859/g.40041  ORF Transcript_16859/g.40041 Transcript_16859/m.40041 type:complete len:115 (-) Transcript_16859:753-1097(-)
MVVDSHLVHFGFWDTANREGQEPRLRPLCYPQTDVFLITFQLDSSESLNQVKTDWFPELQRHAPGVPLVLVGTVGETPIRNVESKQAIGVCKSIGASAYVCTFSPATDSQRSAM